MYVKGLESEKKKEKITMGENAPMLIRFSAEMK
jgi:hypothetical protein